MKLSTGNMYMFIHYNLRTLTDRDPRPAVLYWMKNKDRRDQDRQKGRQQSYFKGVFAEGSQPKGGEFESSDSDQ